MLDLFAIARSNANAVQAAFAAAIAACSPDQATSLREFASWIKEEGLVSINVRLYIVVELLSGGRYQNTHEWAQEQCRLSGRAADEILRERLDKFYEKRVAFDHAFRDGERFRYGAFNAGGTGLPEYAPYCAVLSRAFCASLQDVAYLPGDSLKMCFNAGGSLDRRAVERYPAPHSYRHMLAANERAKEVPTTERRQWHKLVTSANRFFEVIFLGEITLTSIDSVRISRAEHDRMWDMAFASFGRKLADAERALVHDFVQLRRAVVDGRVRLEVLS